MAAENPPAPLRGPEGIAEELEAVRKIRKRFSRGTPFIAMPTNDDGDKLIGTLALQFNYESMMVMLSHYGVAKRVGIKPLEKQARWDLSACTAFAVNVCGLRSQPITLAPAGGQTF